MSSLRFRGKRGVVLGLVLPTVFGIGVLAVAINDGGKMVAAQVSADSAARAAATTGADTWFRTHRADLTERDATMAAQQSDPTARVLWVTIDQRAGRVTVRVEKRADTLLVDRVGFLERYAVQGATKSEVRTS
jgi:hypothetical protein